VGARCAHLAKGAETETGERGGGKVSRIVENLAIRVWTAFGELLKRQEGQTVTEYGLILSLVSIVAIGILTTIGDQVHSLFVSIVDTM
jgi:Flp pilus assembly pilin Flp